MQYGDFLDQLEQDCHLERGTRQRVELICQESGEAWDQVLLRLGAMAEGDLSAHLASALGWPLWGGQGELALPLGINPHFAEQHRLVAVTQKGQETALGVVNPFDAQAISGAEFSVGKSPSVIIPFSAFNSFINEQGPLEPPQSETSEADVALDIDQLQDLASTEPIVRQVTYLITKASHARASDLHIEPTDKGYQLHHRVDGRLRAVGQLSRTDGLAVISRFKILAHLDIAEQRRPQDGRLTFPVEGRRIDLRVSAVATDHGESLVLRLLDQAAHLHSYQDLGYTDEQIAKIRSIIHRPHGLVAVTGPTGSGKTTSLYAMLSELADGERKVLTIEDPIEYRLAGVLQSQVNTQIGVTFSSALRSFLRHDPDVIMVGEIRDKETAEMATQAALTGHLVLTTLHTNDAPSAITRLRDLGVEDYLIASTL
ncbi:MAG: GspE/PulE family protein, partial [Pseudomonadota bacterium]